MLNNNKNVIEKVSRGENIDDIIKNVVLESKVAVSYTHLDVYKRQILFIRRYTFYLYSPVPSSMLHEIIRTMSNDIKHNMNEQSIEQI